MIHSENVEGLQDLMTGVLPRLLRQAPLTPEKVQFAWRSAVGPQIARATRVELRDGRLLVSAEDERWAREVERAAHLILPKLRAILGDAHVASLAIAP
jgi:predicted nucleic acid-binding Zn ribbon protein